jgi:N6-adenosine-specific RNA methylase IME4
MYDIAYADPPWRFEVHDRDTGLKKSADRHYKTMHVDEICAMKPDMATNSVLVLWVYDPMYPEAMQVGSAWGFKFVTPLFRWLKTTKNGKMHFGTGYHTRGGACEEAWLFKRGRGLPVLRHDIRKEFHSPLQDHSRKPAQVANWIIDLYGDRPRIEMFARDNKPGWDTLGDEVGKFGSSADR